MEHLLPQLTKSKVRIPSYQIQPDDDGITATVDECAHIFESAIKNHRDGSVDEKLAQHYLWLQSCTHGRKKNLCHVLLNQFYFGRLLQILGPEVVVADFTVRGEDGVVYLTTVELESHLRAWKGRVERLDDEAKEILKQQCYLLLEQAAVVLSSLHTFLWREYRADLIPDLEYYADDYEDEADPLGLTHFACVVLHQALVQACGKVLGIAVRAGNALSLRSKLPWLLTLMERIEGWCPYTVFKLYRVSDVDELVFGHAMGTVRASTGEHEECTSTQCMANNVSVLDGGVRHVNAGCDCWLVESPMEDIVEILKAGGIPVLRISTDDGYKLSLEARRASLAEGATTTKYVALSHVWADGLGSPTSNIIAQCQLTRIADRLGRLESAEKCGELCIWIDTLCIPVDPKLQELRDLHITRMHDVYKHAYAVMIMDADTLRMSQEATISEVGMRLDISVWGSRLWTYQEGAMNERVLVMTATGVIDIDKMLTEARDRDEDEDALSHNIVDKMVRTTYFGLGRPQNDQSQNDRLNSDSFAQTMLRAICNRTTSRPDDETVIIGTALNVDVAPILAAPPQDRMVTMLRTMPFIPGNVLFTLGPRLNVEGLRWAPATFLHSNNAWVTNGSRDLVPMNMKQVREGKVSRRPKAVLGPNGVGLRTFNPGIRLGRLFKPGPNSPLLVFKLFDTVFDFQGLTTEAHFDDYEGKTSQTKRIEDMLVAGRELVILLPEFDPNMRIYCGALIDVHSDDKPIDVVDGHMNSTTRAKYCMPVAISNRNLVDLPEAAAQESDDGSWRDMHEVSPPGEMSENGDDASRRYVADWVEPRFWLVE